MKQDLQDFHVQQTTNETAFFEILKTLSPDLYVLIKMIMNEKLNIAVFYKLARHLVNINAGTGYGDIHILIEDKTVRFINGTEKDKVGESIIKIAS
jgi:hypothetical protein